MLHAHTCAACLVRVLIEWKKAFQVSMVARGTCCKLCFRVCTLYYGSLCLAFSAGVGRSGTKDGGNHLHMTLYAMLWWPENACPDVQRMHQGLT